MTPEQFKRAETIFQAACALPVSERSAFVEQACAGQDELHSHVRVLLEHHERPAIRLESPQVVAAMRASDETILYQPPPQRPAPARIRGYQVLKTLGEGGFGVVYLAEQERPRRTVALKVLRPGLFSRNILRRFEYEAYVLGRLQHPGIAQIYEAGAVDPDQPDLAFIAMEYVPGLPLTDYVERNKLSVRERVELCSKICDAVQHAHQRGVIHRDLKPANILVAEDNELATKPQSHSATKGDARGGQDVSRPDRVAGPSRADPQPGKIRQGIGILRDSMASSRRRLPNPPPSWLRGSVSSCLPSAQPKVLDFGVARATDADLHATTMHTHSGQLVGTLPYMSPEQVAGNPDEVDTRSDVYALGVILYRLLTGKLPYELPQHSVAEAARIIREEEPSRLSALNRTLRGDLETIVAKALEKDKARRYPSAAELGADLRRYLHHEPIAARPPSSFYQLRKFARRHKGLVASLAGVFVVLVAGVIVSTSYYVSAERARADAVAARDEADQRRTEAEDQRAEAQRQAAIASAINTFLNRDLLGAVDPTSAKQRDISVREVLDQASREIEGGSLGDRPEVEAEVRSTIGVTYRELARFAEAQSHLESALRLLTRLRGERDFSVIETMQALGRVHFLSGNYAEAEPLFRRTLDLQRETLGKDHPSVGSGLASLALLLQAKGDFPAAKPLVEEALEIARGVPDRKRVEMADFLAVLGSLLVQKGERAQAEPLLRESLELRRALLPAGHPHVALSLVDLAKVVRDGGDPAAAEPLYREAIEIQRRRLGDAHPDLAVSLNHLANTMAEQGRTAEAAPLFGEALTIQRKLLGPAHPEIATSTNNLAILYWQNGEDDAAEPLFYEALTLLRRQLGDDHPTVATARNNLSALLRGKGDYDGAEALVRQSLEVVRSRLGDEHPLMAGNLNNLASILGAKGDYPQAEPLAREALVLHVRLFGGDHVNTAFALATLGTVLVEGGRPEEGEQRLRECLAIRQAALPPDHWLLGDAMSRLGAGLTGLGCFDEAEEDLLDAHVILRDNPQARRDVRRKVVERLGELYLAWGRLDRAGEWAEAIAAETAD